MRGESRGLEQRGVSGPEPAGGGGAGRATHHGGRASPQLFVRRADAVQRADELQWLGGGEIAGKALWGAPGGLGRLPPCVEVSDHDRVAAVARGLQRAPSGVEQAPVHRRRRGHGGPLDGLRGEVHTEVRLVPDLPEADPRQVARIARHRLVHRRVIRAAVARPDRLHELLEGRSRGLPFAEAARLGLTAAGGPLGRRTADREVDDDPVLLRVLDDLVVDLPPGVGRRVGAVKARRAHERRQAAPVNRDPQDAATQVADLLERGSGRREQTGVVLEHLDLPAVGMRPGRRDHQTDSRDDDRQPGSRGEAHCRRQQTGPG